ncbi:MAG: hypothetical protein LQ343_007978 [Gyalolechia ehrenbergii]|nr:MAG: hypothetical protein LQ343_007978 [Gyalolechia ehrenbergii]
MTVNFNPHIFQTLLGILWLRRNSRIDSPSLTVMDAFDGANILLFPGVCSPGEAETQLEIHANVDESIPVSIISRPVLNWLQRSCDPCEAIEIQDRRNLTYRPFGKIVLHWHKVGFARQYDEMFYVIESETQLVRFGASASSKDNAEAGTGTYPLELGQQTPEQRAQQAQKKAEAEKRRAEEQKQQEVRDREKRQT